MNWLPLAPSVPAARRTGWMDFGLISAGAGALLRQCPGAVVMVSLAAPPVLRRVGQSALARQPFALAGGKLTAG
jgi:hypothetical protein